MRASPVSIWRHLVRGLRALGNERVADRDLQDELSHYAEQFMQSKLAAGEAPDSARRAVQREVGNMTNIREGVRASLWESTLSSAWSDARYAVRTLRRNPVFTLVVTLVIAVGIGAVTTIFAGANAYLFKPLPGASNTPALLQFDRITPDASQGTSASFPYYRYLRDQTSTLSAVAAWSKVDLTISRGSVGRSAYGALVTANYFSVLGVKPELGRFFLLGEDEGLLAHPLVVVSHEFWATHLGSDSSLVGKEVGVNGRPYTLIGVAPPAFLGVFTPLKTSGWVTLSMQPALRPTRTMDGNAHWLWTFGRLRDGATREQAQLELTRLTTRYVKDATEQEWASKYTTSRAIPLTGLPDDARKVMAAFLAVLFAASLTVLTIAGVNVAAMLSARAIARRHEIALRAALGAPRSRLIRQLMTETLVLFAVGATAGVLLALLATRALERMPLPTDEPLVILLPLDGRVLLFAVVLSLGAGLLFGLRPALRAARQDLQTQLRSEGSGSGRRRPVVSNVLVAGQLALSMVLLVTAGLLVRALQSGQRTNPGFTADGVSVASLSSESWGYDTPRAKQFFSELRTRVEAVPGVQNVSYTTTVPVTLSGSQIHITPDVEYGAAAAPASKHRIGTNTVDADFFSLLRIPVILGRVIGTQDAAGSLRVAVINETMAKRYWPKQSAIGRTFKSGDEQITVVGVVRDAKYQTLNEVTEPFAYMPFAQEWRSDPTLIVRSSIKPAAIAKAITQVVHEIDAALPPPKVLTLPDAMSFSLIPQRVAALIAGALGFVGLLLATVGLYGIVAYSVGQRAREIGIRMTLGAQRGDVQRRVVRDGMKLAGIGVLGGLLLAVGASQLLDAYLYGVSPLDAPTYTAMSLLFVAVTLLANYLPARRASMADPMRVLRGE